MIDKYGREIDYLRISLTDRCNLRCIYCMPEEGVKSLSHAEILTYDEILRICRCAADLGIRKIKLTGGEPLVRKGCASLAKQIKAIPGIEKVTLTTNGILLAEQLDALLDAGIDAINISLDTLDPELFKKVSNPNPMPKVLPTIQEWYGYEGNFKLTEQSRIVVNDAAGVDAEKAAKEMQSDIHDICGLDLEIVKGTSTGTNDIYLESQTEDVYDVGKEGYLMVNGDAGLKIYSPKQDFFTVL